MKPVDPHSRILVGLRGRIFATLILWLLTQHTPFAQADEPIHKVAGDEFLEVMIKDHGYHLEDGQAVVRVAPPFPANRLAYYRASNPSQAEAIPSGPDAMSFRWTDGKLNNWGMSFGDPKHPGYNLKSVLDVLLRVKSQQVEGPKKLLEKRIPGDWIVRTDATQADVIKQLNSILNDQLAWKVKIEFRDVERPVYVARGEYQWIPLTPERSEINLGQPWKASTDTVEIYGKLLVPDTGSGGGSGDLDEMLTWLGRWIDVPMISEVANPPKDRLSWMLHGRNPATKRMRQQDHNPDLVLANISKQTGLTFSREQRKISILFVEPIE